MRFASEEFLDCKKWIAERIESGSTWEQVKLFCVSEEDAPAVFDTLQTKNCSYPRTWNIRIGQRW